MHIITGKYKGRQLKTVEGRTTRPTSSFYRELVFSVYQDYTDKRVLDLYAGTGYFGLEALSRGANWVDFVEFAIPALTVILKNVENLGCSRSCHIWRKNVFSFLRNTEQKWDVIFLDPPYNKRLLNSTLELIFSRNLLNPEGIVIAEHSPSETVAEIYRDRIINSKVGKTTCFTFLQ
ncbi:MAG: 16S rRNA (guanine(966)-N(2))-methyltransferase RsmD [Candidatus Cloacimonadaceae bacterium]|jgi:16S rRNA (guanine966-N2)-methyltransferase|nr:16S rRNA (guanine(966)-N(2))-methyltransferase RsmD [Candidatus Cloacimonadota bacterium]MCB5257866.1 16S rRNA (guanine(966)-N(2))-methyltransferase RsmD [Candidatus Cloacimonadota bacterium]MDY0111453.1 16S rRNA (guanine(966)-N(2))-methyltransferase RsmD [Candidatus Syntrophosphaera sp.]